MNRKFASQKASMHEFSKAKNSIQVNMSEEEVREEVKGMSFS